MLVFPREFAEVLLQPIARCRAYVRDQLELVPEGGNLELPAELALLWLKGMLLTAVDQRATSHAKLVQYLKAAEFFQDNYLIEKLHNALGSRVFRAQGNGEQQSHHADPPDKVMEGLSDYQGMAVLLCAPGTCKELLIQLPASLQPVACLAHVQGIAAICSPATEAPECRAERPVLAISVDCSQCVLHVSYIDALSCCAFHENETSVLDGLQWIDAPRFSNSVHTLHSQYQSTRRWSSVVSSCKYGCNASGTMRFTERK